MPCLTFHDAIMIIRSANTFPKLRDCLSFCHGKRTSRMIQPMPAVMNNKLADGIVAVAPAIRAMAETNSNISRVPHSIRAGSSWHGNRDSPAQSNVVEYAYHAVPAERKDTLQPQAWPARTSCPSCDGTSA